MGRSSIQALGVADRIASVSSQQPACYASAGALAAPRLNGAPSAGLLETSSSCQLPPDPLCTILMQRARMEQHFTGCTTSRCSTTWGSSPMKLALSPPSSVHRFVPCVRPKFTPSILQTILPLPARYAWNEFGACPHSIYWHFGWTSPH